MEITYDLMKRVNAYELNRLADSAFSKLPSNQDQQTHENW
jgi:hypothetical protein